MQYKRLLFTGAASLLLAACSQLSDSTLKMPITPFENYKEMNYIRALP